MQKTYSISLDSPPMQPLSSKPPLSTAVTSNGANVREIIKPSSFSLQTDSFTDISNSNKLRTPSSAPMQQRSFAGDKGSNNTSGFFPTFQILTKNNDNSISSSTTNNATSSATVRTRKRMSGSFANPTISSMTPKTATSALTNTPSRFTRKQSTSSISSNVDKNANNININKTIPSINFDQVSSKQVQQQQHQQQQTAKKPEMKRALRVAIRARPSSSELGLSSSSNQTGSNGDIGKESVVVQSNMNRIGTSQQDFFFDNVFEGSDNTQSVFSSLVQPLIDDILSGKSDKGTVLVYGQTGSGKTYTMGILSPVTDPHSLPSSSSNFEQFDRIPENVNKNSSGSTGIIPLALRQIFESPLRGGAVKISFCQLYIDCVYDLIEPQQQQNRSNENDFYRSNSMPAFITSTNSSNFPQQYKMGTSLMVREDPGKGFYVEGLTESEIQTYEGAINLINVGLSNRAMASTWMNNTSSRSHTLLTLQFQNGRKMTFVDLAGSERLPMDDIDPQRLEEAKSINTSLSALGNVVYALADSKTKHIPYRDSKLTRLLQDSLSRGSETLLIATISPDPVDYRETLSSLLFAERCMKIEFVQEQQQKFITLVNEERAQREIMLLNEQLKIKQQQQLEYAKLLSSNNKSDISDDSTMYNTNTKLKQQRDSDSDQSDGANKKKLKSLENKLKRACEILDEILLAHGIKDIQAPIIDGNIDSGSFYEEIEEVKRVILKKASNQSEDPKKLMNPLLPTSQVKDKTTDLQQQSITICTNDVSVFSKDCDVQETKQQDSIISPRYHDSQQQQKLHVKPTISTSTSTTTQIQTKPQCLVGLDNETPPESSRPTPQPSPLGRTMMIDCYGGNIRPLSQLDEFLQTSNTKI